MDENTIGGRIRLAWTNAGFEKGAAFARAIGVTPTTLYRYQSNTCAPSIWALQRIARCANVRMEWLVTGEGKTVPCDEPSGNTPLSDAPGTL